MALTLFRAPTGPRPADWDEYYLLSESGIPEQYPDDVPRLPTRSDCTADGAYIARKVSRLQIVARDTVLDFLTPPVVSDLVTGNPAPKGRFLRWLEHAYPVVYDQLMAGDDMIARLYLVRLFAYENGWTTSRPSLVECGAEVC